jgi:hypothetical protein
MYEFPKPGAEQALLAKWTGDFHSDVRFYVAPGVPPMVKTGSYSAKLDLGGYFLHREFRVELDDAGDFKALAFHGRGLTGYDPFQRKYVGVWVDSGSPALYLTQASFNAAGDTYMETSHGPDPNGHPLILRMVTTFSDRDRLSFKMFRVDASGGETLTAEMDHVRIE